MKNGKGHPKTAYNLLLTATLQIFIVDLFKTLDLKPKVHGAFNGVFIKAYFENLLTLEQTVLSLFYLSNLIGDGKPQIPKTKGKQNHLKQK